MHWLPRRKDFDITKWYPPCKCKHTNIQHKPNKPTKCSKCACFGFTSDFCCISCDRPFEEHYTLIESEKERIQLGKPVGMEHWPLASHPEIQAETMKKLGIDGRSAEQRFIDEIQEEKKLQERIDAGPYESSMGIPMTAT